MRKKEIVALIPARGGSKRIPKKNVVLLAGKPLISYTIEASLSSKWIDRTIVSTDDDEIGVVSSKYGAEVLKRPKHISEDDSTTEDVMSHLVKEFENTSQNIDYLVLLQPTTPFRNSKTVDEGIEVMLKFDVDSLLSVCEVQHYYLMGHFENEMYELEYEERPFSQNMIKKYRENGALYITKKDFFLRTHNRIGGKIKAVVMDEVDSIDIDNSIDLERAEKLMKMRQGTRDGKEKRFL